MNWAIAHNPDYDNYLNGEGGSGPTTTTTTTTTTSSTTTTSTGPTVRTNMFILLRSQDSYDFLRSPLHHMTILSLVQVLEVSSQPIASPRQERMCSSWSAVDLAQLRPVARTIRHGPSPPTLVSSYTKYTNLEADINGNVAHRLRYSRNVRGHVHQLRPVVVVHRFVPRCWNRLREDPLTR